MTRRKEIALLVALALAAPAVMLVAQEGPKKDPGETVAKPRRPGQTTEEELPKIPSRLGNNKDRPQLPEGLPSFQSDVALVNVDVSVVDNKGNFIPNIPQQHFRVLEDNVPQQVKTFGTGEAPMTVAMVIEFSNRSEERRGGKDCI